VLRELVVNLLGTEEGADEVLRRAWTRFPDHASHAGGTGGVGVTPEDPGTCTDAASHGRQIGGPGRSGHKTFLTPTATPQ